jgi:hypothetical protein
MYDVDFFDGKESSRSRNHPNVQSMHVCHAVFSCQQPSIRCLAFFSQDSRNYSASLKFVARLLLIFKKRQREGCS